MKLTYLAIFLSLACASKGKAEPKDPTTQPQLDAVSCDGLKDDSGFFVSNTYASLSETTGQITVVQYADSKCTQARQAFRVSGPLRHNTHKLASGTTAETQYVVIEKMEIAGWDDSVLGALNGDGQSTAACGKSYAKGQFVTVGAECLTSTFFVRDAAKLVRLAVGNHYIFK